MKLIAVVSAYICRNGKVLLLQRSGHNRHFTGKWQLPEGKIEPGETPLSALSRELKEELQCDIALAKFAGEIRTSLMIDHEKIVVKRSIFTVSLSDYGHIHLSPEHTQFVWQGLPLPENLALYPGTDSVIEVAKIC